ncbi:hypothetical protein G6F70_001421 [Rhizopus microsporus]|uniref:BZIP domain-containing protein n=1 Tax=Rhizopus azygosporus TaxID=86630 RepID=A0A367K9P4_RHIAZ|nr:hypothetical protein G6F71_001064 [Rhizopus microsporus]RCH98551.1 hypothetical protein CU097_012273 [Rhizopus azygosporus]KAG1203409.1 hypothetical protein G6F70_001421 [Rhizopus microsporus]KAG1215280.1 hypothetical protein G6F69_001170 [Rhizopus microsporus]KAG1237777.1 hypothetical protein G6F67_000948 [Rhizopus microsporus]
MDFNTLDSNYTVLTPTRFLMDSTTANDWNFSTASNFYMNTQTPFQDPKQGILIAPPSPTMTDLSPMKSYAPNTPPTPPTQTKSPPPLTPKKTDPNEERKQLLEKNRQAAYRCRQKKKRWVQELEEKSEISEKRNRELQEQVARLREESIYLRNLLLTHGNCECKVVQAYLRRTSANLSSRPSMIPPDSSYNPNCLFTSSSQKHYV